MVTISKFQAQIGYNFTLLDIGGGFPGAPDAAITFEEVGYEVIIISNTGDSISKNNAQQSIFDEI